MKVTGTATLRAPREAVWRALQDPEVLVRTIPGCQELQAVGADAYQMTISAGVASIKGIYAGTVSLADQSPPESYTLVASGQGAPGTVRAEARVRLADGDGGGTLLSYDADAVVGGMIGGVGQRVLASVAKRTAGEFFTAVDRYLAGESAAPAEPAVTPAQREPEAVGGPVPVAAGQLFRAPDRSRPPAVAGGDLIGAAALGGFLALAGVLVGWLIGRRR
ncbi:MAG: SRPBCC family protein [Frankiaceae bacterium]